MEAAADAPISSGFFRTVPILLTSLVSRITKTSVTASLVFWFTIRSPVLANAFQLIDLRESVERYSLSE